MSLTDTSGRDDLLLRRASYVELLRALQLTAKNNPETIDALERILPDTAADQKHWPSAIRALPDLRQFKHRAA